MTQWRRLSVGIKGGHFTITGGDPFIREDFLQLLEIFGGHQKWFTFAVLTNGNVYCGPTIWPNNDQGLEDLARYIIRACFSQERMTYLPAKDTLDGQAKVIYRSKDGQTSKTFEALDWLAQLVTHVPNKGEQMVCYHGYYSNKSRGMRKKTDIDNQVPALVESAVSFMAFRRSWAWLIQKIYQIDPLLCPKCQGAMKIISFIEDDALIKKILKHLGLWETKNHDPPQLNEVHIPTIET